MASLLRGLASQRMKSDEQIDWSKQGVKKLKNEIRSLAFKARDQGEPPKILFIGETGSGKSSFISSIVSALKGSIVYTSTVGEKEGHEINTSKRYLEHRVFMEEEDTSTSKKRKSSREPQTERQEQPLNFVLCDSRGLAKRNQQGAADEEIDRLIDGKLRHGDLIEDERSYDGSRISDREPKPPCCVVFVQKAQRLGEVDTGVKNKLHRASELVRERGIPSCVVLTHIDQVKTGLENKMNMALKSVKIQERIRMAAKEAGVNENRVFVVKNYTNEHRTHIDHDVLILRALMGILMDVQQRDQDKYAHGIGRPIYPSVESGYHSLQSTVSSVSTITQSQAASSVADSGPSTSVSRQIPQGSEADAPVRLRKRQELVAAYHSRQISAPVEPHHMHKEVIKSLSSGELPKGFVYHIRKSPQGSQEGSKSDVSDELESGIGSSQAIQETLLQEYIHKLKDYRFPELYSEKAQLRGAKPLYRPTVFQLKNSSITPMEESGLCHQLIKEIYDDTFFSRLKADLEEWSNHATGALWMSDTLHVDFGLPIDVTMPESVHLQVLFLTPELPPFLLTVYHPENILEGKNITDELDSKKMVDKATADVRDFTAKTSRLLTTAFFNYCHCDFILLPVAVSYNDFCVEFLENEVRKQQECTRMYYDGPRRLTQKMYSELRAAARAVCSVSHVPRLLQADLDSTEVKQRVSVSSESATEEPLCLLDPSWQGTVSLLIEKLTRRKQAGDITDFTYANDETSYFKIKVAVMEAAKRLSFAEEVVVVTQDRDLQGCCQRLKDIVAEDTGLKLTLSVVSPPSPDQQGTPSSAIYLIIFDLPDFRVTSEGVVLYINRDMSRASISTV